MLEERREIFKLIGKSYEIRFASDFDKYSDFSLMDIRFDNTL